MNVSEIINHTINCACGRNHRCDIEELHIGQGVLEHLSEIMAKYADIILISDQNTDAICGDRVRSMLGDSISAGYVFEQTEPVVPDEAAVSKIEKLMTDKADFVLGIGSGVINDICKYVSFNHKIPCGIIATATSMY